MNRAVWQQIQNTIRSLENSTRLVIQTPRVKCQLSGRNSPYKSHRTVTFEDEFLPGGILFYNDRVWLYIGNEERARNWDTFRPWLPDYLRGDLGQVRYRQQCYADRIPRGKLMRLIELTIEYHGQWPEDLEVDLVPVAIGLRVMIDYWRDRPVFELLGPRLSDPIAEQGELRVYAVDRDKVSPELPHIWRWSAEVEWDRQAGTLDGDLIWVLVNGGSVQVPGYPESVELPEPEEGTVYVVAHRWT